MYLYTGMSSLKMRSFFEEKLVAATAQQLLAVPLSVSLPSGCSSDYLEAGRGRLLVGLIGMLYVCFHLFRVFATCV
jgi:hypothetical protein